MPVAGRDVPVEGQLIWARIAGISCKNACRVCRSITTMAKLASARLRRLAALDYYTALASWRRLTGVVLVAASLFSLAPPSSVLLASASGVHLYRLRLQGRKAVTLARSSLGSNDIDTDMKFCGVCNTDLHTGQKRSRTRGGYSR